MDETVMTLWGLANAIMWVFCARVASLLPYGAAAQVAVLACSFMAALCTLDAAEPLR